METPQPDNDLQIDLNGIKNFFTKTVRTIHSLAKGESRPESNNTLTTIKHFVTKHTTLSFLTLLLILQFVPNAGFLPWGGMHLRLQADDILLGEKAARDIVYDNFYNKFYNALSKQQPNLPDIKKEEIVHQNLAALIDTDPLIQQERQKLANAIRKEYQYTTNGKIYTYMPDIDSYRYLRLANNVLERGHIGDTIKEGIPWDNHATAPLGSNISIELHPYTLAAIHKTIIAFSPTTPLMQTAAYFPIIATILTLITLFFIGKTLSNPLGGFVTATLFSLNYIVFTKTAIGMSDTDAYNILFPSIFMYFFIKSITTKKWTSTIFSSVVLGLYAFTWAGWWYTLYIAMAATIIAITLHIIATCRTTNIAEKTFKPAITIAITTILFILVSTIILTYILSYKQYSIFDFQKGFDSLKTQIQGPFSFSKIDSAARIDLWPNVYTSVAELSKPDINRIIDFSGGTIFLLTAIIGLFILIKNNPPTQKKFIYGVFLTLTIIAAFYAALKGQRFILLIVAPATIAVGHTLLWGWEKITQNNKKPQSEPGSEGHRKGVSKIIGTIFLFITLVILTTDQQTRIDTWLDNSVPNINDAWWQTLTQIKEKTPQNAIITSWWDFGHHFAYIANRAVTFDGGSQNTPMAHWVGKMLSTSNEKEAVGILRMLACGSNKAYDTLIEKYNYTQFEAYKITSNLTRIQKKEDAKKYLEPNQNTEEILQYTHCDPPENYFITSEDMRRKAGVWSHFGNWDFKKAYVWQVLKHKPIEEAVQLMTTNLSYTNEEATHLYEQANSIIYDDKANLWIGPAWTYTLPHQCKQLGTTLQCGSLILFDLEKHTAHIKTTEGEVYSANKLTFINEKTEKFTTITNTSGTLGAIIFQDGPGTYYGIGATPELTTSMFTRLMYFDGHGLQHFKPFAKEKLIDGGFVSTWKVDWNGDQPIVAPAYQHQESVSNTSTVTFNIISWIEDGEVIDSTIKNWKENKIKPTTRFEEHPTDPRTRTFGAGRVIPALEQAMIGMKHSQTKIITVQPKELFSADNELLQKIGNKTISFKIRIERIR